MEKSDAPVPEADPKALELPDWSGMEDSASRITPEAALRLCELYPRLAAAARSRTGIQRSQPCPVEFVL